MKLSKKYIIGTHIMFYEIEMAREHIESIINATNRVANKENVMIDLLFNISEYFENFSFFPTGINDPFSILFMINIISCISVIIKLQNL